MPDTHNKLQYPTGITITKEKKLGLFLDLNYFSFSKANSNPKQLH